MRQMVSHFVAPNDKLPSRNAGGMRESPSSVATITTGNVNIARVTADHKTPGVPKVGFGKASG